MPVTIVRLQTPVTAGIRLRPHTVTFVPKLPQIDHQARLAQIPTPWASVIDRSTGTIYYRGDMPPTEWSQGFHNQPHKYAMKRASISADPHAGDLMVYRRDPTRAPGYEEVRRSIPFLRRLRTRIIADTSPYEMPETSMRLVRIDQQPAVTKTVALIPA